MLRAMSEWGQLIAAAALCSVSIKLLDDYLDRETDAACGTPNLINHFGEGLVAYCLPFLVVSIGLHPAVGTCLFFASWAVGMFQDLNAKFVIGMRGWHESLLFSFAGAYLAGWREMVCALLLVSGVQLFDDIYDFSQDHESGMRNLARRWGILPCSVICLICFLVAWHMGGLAFWPVLTGIAIVYAAFVLIGGRLHV